MKWLRGCACMIGLVLASVLSAGEARAGVWVKGTQSSEFRAKMLKNIQKTCKDYNFSWAAAGTDWILTKGTRKQIYKFHIVEPEPDVFVLESNWTTCEPSNRTPKGCQLVCKLIEHSKWVKLDEYIEPVAQTIPEDTENHRNGTGAPCVIGMPLTFEGTGYKSGDKGINNSGFTYDCTNPLPAWLAFAHEMIHALHILNGDVTSDPNHPEDTWPEEGTTVSGTPPNGSEPGLTENALGAEQGLPPRLHGNCGIPTRRAW